MSWYFRERVDRQELLDLGAGSPRETTRSLADLRRLNRLLGGWRMWRRHLLPRIEAIGAERVRILDVGTASGDLPRRLLRVRLRGGGRLEVVGVDASRRHLEIARRHLGSGRRMRLAGADARRLPFRDGSFDIAVMSLLLHHFPDGEAPGVLGELARVARRSVFISDLLRHPLAYAGLRLVQPLLARSPLTRFDGPVSIRTGFTPHEAVALSRRAGLPRCRVEIAWPGRICWMLEVP